MKLKIILVVSFFMCLGQVEAQELKGFVRFKGEPVNSAKIRLSNSQNIYYTDSLGSFNLFLTPNSTNRLLVEAEGFKLFERKVEADSLLNLVIELQRLDQNVEEVVVSGTLKEVSKLDSPVPVEIYTANFFKKNPTPNVFEALSQINGVRPQINCSVCNTGDIHINGLEGPYTMILIDGMPIVSSLSTVYGLSGIPNSLIDRVEIVRGPASSLYGSEAIGGLINIITKQPSNSATFLADAFGTSYGEYNLDLGWNAKLSDRVSVLTGLNHFSYSNPVDKNKDNFTDITLQNRWSLFQKWSVTRKRNRQLSLAARFNYEDRWGGEMNWTPQFRGGNSIYGESIYTSRYEVFGNYQLPSTPKLILSFSFNDHTQNSVYGTTSYKANQMVAFSQLTYDKSFKSADFLAGLALRYNRYDDNTPATASPDGLRNIFINTYLPGVFVQNEFKLNGANSVLLGMRYDYNSNHGSIVTPRLAYKLKLKEDGILRLNFGTGFRVVNLFTEDHAALNGSREVEIISELKPERSYNANLNYFKKFPLSNGSLINLDITAFYTHFTNRIVGDFETDASKIRYDNLKGYAVSSGISLNMDAILVNGLKASVGTTLMDIYVKDDAGNKSLPILSEQWTGTWNISYKPITWNVAIDYTGNIYGKMRMARLNDLDPRTEFSSIWSIQNVQATYSGFGKFEIYGGLKNFLNFTPGRKQPFLISRSHDPFNKNVQYDAQNQIVSNPENPYALSFDPGFIYAPNQGARVFVGIRYLVK